MQNLLLSLVACAITFFSFNSANAEGQLFLGYCDGQIASKTSGVISSRPFKNATIGVAIRIPGSMLAAYQGLQITSVHAGLPEASEYPEALTGWITASKGGERITTGTLSALETGWNSIPLEQSYTITGNEEELWFGFEFEQAEILDIISFAGETIDDGCWVITNGKFNNYSRHNFGSVAVEATIEGDNIPQHNLSILSASTSYTMTQLGEPIKTNARITNSAVVAAEKPVIECSLNGNLVYTY